MSFLTPALSSTLSFFIWPHPRNWIFSLVSHNKKYHDADYRPDDRAKARTFETQRDGHGKPVTEGKKNGEPGKSAEKTQRQDLS